MALFPEPFSRESWPQRPEKAVVLGAAGGRNFVIPLARDQEYAQKWQFSGLFHIQRTKQSKLTSN